MIVWRIAIFLVSLALFLPLIDTPHDYSFDEGYHAFTAAEQMRGNPDAWTRVKSTRPGTSYEWSHPPLGKIFIGLGIAAFGDRPFGWRVTSSIAGAVGVVLLFDLALAATGSAAVAALASLLLLLSGLWLVQSRVAMLDSFLAMFTTAVVHSLHGWWTAAPEARRVWLLRLAACSGLALAVKWSALFPVFAAAVTVLGVTLYENARAWKTAIRRALVLTILPAAIYTGSYGPYFAAGHGAGDFVVMQQRMAAYHTGLRKTHTRQSRWWSWPLLVRPVWYDVDRERGEVANVYAQGNPILFWAFVPAVAWVLRRWWVERQSAALAAVAIGFVGQWVPWAISPRITFLYHFLPAVPFGCLAIAVALRRAWNVSERGRQLAFVYVAAAAFTFAFFYPLYAGVPLSKPMLERRIWFASWR